MLFGKNIKSSLLLFLIFAVSLLFSSCSKAPELPEGKIVSRAEFNDADWSDNRYLPHDFADGYTPL